MNLTPTELENIHLALEYFTEHNRSSDEFRQLTARVAQEMKAEVPITYPIPQHPNDPKFLGSGNYG